MRALCLFFACFLHYATGQGWPIPSSDISLAGSQPVSIPNFRVNLRQTATLTVTHTQDVQVCIQEAFPVPVAISWWNQSCTRYFSFQGSGSSQPSTVAAILRDVNYSLSVALWDRVGAGLTDKKDSISFSLGSSGDSCADGQVFNDLLSACLIPTNVTVNSVINYTFADASQRAYFYFTIPPRTDRIDIFSTAGDSASCVFQLRRMASPAIQSGFYDGVSGAHASFDHPRPGKYYFVARSTNAGVGMFTVTAHVCGNNSMINGTLGPNCSIPYNSNPQPNMNLVAVEGQWTYWQYQCSSQRPLSVMVTSSNGAYFPRIYASRDQLPLDTNADLANCHGTSCDGVNTLNLTCSELQYWYIGVTSAPGINGTSYGVWFTPVCAPGCSAHGVCSYSDPTVGQCVCDPQYLGPNCSTESDVNARFIVLCVIAGLLVASAAVGLIVQKVQVWRKSKLSYQQL